MEDLGISPWENQESKTLTNFHHLRNKSTSKVDEYLYTKNRFIHTESNDHPQLTQKKKQYHLGMIRKKGQSSSTHQNFYESNRCSSPSKLQIKLVSYPIQQRCKQRQAGVRFSEKLQGKQNHINQSFEVIQTIFNTQLRKLKVFKERPLLKNKTCNETILKSKFEIKSLSRVGQSLEKLKAYTQEKYPSEDCYPKSVKRCYPEQQSKFLIERNQSIQQEKFMMRKKSSSKKKFQKYSSTQNQYLQEINRTFDSKYQIRDSQGKTTPPQQQMPRTRVHKQRRLSMQKLQNINCFKDTTNIFVNLKKKNKNLFNQLEKYNLFGLRNLKRKNLKNQ